MGFLRKSTNIISKSEEIIIVVVMLWIAGAMFLEIALRYIFHAPLFGIEEVIIITAAWLYFIGVARATKIESHIKVVIIGLFVKNRLFLKWNKLSSLFLSIIASGILFYLALEHSLWSVQAGVVTSGFQIPISYTTSSVVVAGSLMFLHLTIQLARELKAMRNPDAT